jgi:holo-ACP synthase/triphosphoribosyl-dephospho-CoA synthase
LAAREQRSLLRRQLAIRGMPSVSLTLNIPGYPKSNAIARSFFNTCLVDFQYFLNARQIWWQVHEVIERTDDAGDFMLVPFSSSLHTATEVKQICEAFEEMHPLGRFIDADVTNREGIPVSSGKAKLCFYCGQQPAILCRRENAHDLKELREFMFSKMKEYCRQRRRDEICKILSSLALRAILYEISLSPKPGLVDKFGNGSHSDMNYQTFMKALFIPEVTLPGHWR